MTHSPWGESSLGEDRGGIATEGHSDVYGLKPSPLDDSRPSRKPEGKANRDYKTRRRRSMCAPTIQFEIGRVMNTKRIREQMLKLCESICEDDGQDPREVHESKYDRTKNAEHRRQRLCQRVERTLRLVLTESVVELVRELKIESVVPGRNLSALTVNVGVPKGADRERQKVLLELLKSQQGWLRSEVATAISRKRVPRLFFQFTASDLQEREEYHDYS